MLVNWIEQNAKTSVLLPDNLQDGTSVFLEEADQNGSMKIRIDYVPTSSVVIDLDTEGQVGFFKKTGEESFDQRCDYLILTEQDDKYMATFIELKTNRETNDSGGEVQLRWSLPYLRYLIAVFRTAMYNQTSNKELVPRFFRISTLPSKESGSPKGRNRAKRRTRSPLESREYNNILVHYSTKDSFNFKDLAKRKPVTLRPEAV